MSHHVGVTLNQAFACSLTLVMEWRKKMQSNKNTGAERHCAGRYHDPAAAPDGLGWDRGARRAQQGTQRWLCASRAELPGSSTRGTQRQRSPRAQTTRSARSTRRAMEN